MSTKSTSIALSSLPAVGTDLEGGTFAGITTRQDGTHCAVVLLPGNAEDLTWQAAKDWAAEQGGELPTRPVASLLFANVQPALSPEWHWTSEEHNASYAWSCYFNYGDVYYDRKSYDGSVVAVRCIPLTARSFNPLNPGAPTVSAITLEAIHAKQTELAKLIQQFTEQPVDQCREIEIEGSTISLSPGEHYAGIVLDANGEYQHDLILMAAKPSNKLNWKDALEWVEEVGGVLPTRQELSLLFANCKPHLQPVWHWSCEEHESDASYAWFCYFNYGIINYYHKSYEGSAVAVRRT